MKTLILALCAGLFARLMHARRFNQALQRQPDCYNPENECFH